MQSNTPEFVPRIPPLPPPEPDKRRFPALPAWIAVVLIVVLLAFVLVRNFKNDHRPRAQGASDLVQKEMSADIVTKTAFSEVYANRQIRAVTEAAIEASGSTASPKSIAAPGPKAAGSNSSSHTGSENKQKGALARRPKPAGNSGASGTTVYGNAFAETAIQQWRTMTGEPAARGRAWRRLGISLFLFHKPGGMAAFQKILQLPPPVPVPVVASEAPRSIRDRVANIDSSPLPAAEEYALWKTIYGPVAPHPAEVPVLRAKLGRLQLGWFEDVAAAHLYDRAGMTSEAGRASAQAHKSADALHSLLAFETLFQLLGVLLLFVLGSIWAIRAILRAAGAAPVLYPALGPPILATGVGYGPPSAAMTAAAILQNSASEQETKPLPFSYRSRMIAFVVYFGSFQLIAWPFRLLGPFLARLSEQDALRVTMTISVLIYLPLIAVTLAALKWIIESEQGRRITWRELLGAVGLRSDGIGKDIVTAVTGYTMTLPILSVAALISSLLFQKYHTPSNPVELIILTSQDKFTRVLLFVQAVVAAPIVEELMFRGILFQGLRERWGMWLSAVLSAAVFALAHNTLPGGFLVLWTLGFVFAIACHRSRSIAPNILMHAIHNGLVTALMFTVFSK